MTLRSGLHRDCCPHLDHQVCLVLRLTANVERKWKPEAMAPDIIHLNIAPSKDAGQLWQLADTGWAVKPSLSRYSNPVPHGSS